MVELRCLSEHSEFGATLDETLHNRFACGLKYEAIEKRLIGESNKSFKEVVDLAQTMESAKKTSKDLKSKETMGCSGFNKRRGNPAATVEGQTMRLLIVSFEKLHAAIVVARDT